MSRQLAVGNVVGTLVAAIWGFVAFWMVFGTDSPCPVRYPLLFGLVSMLFYLAFNEASWLPNSVTTEMLSLALILIGGIVGIVFLALMIRAYDLDPPQTQLYRLLDRGDDIVDWLLTRL